MSTTPNTHALKLVAIGDSRGVRLSQALLRRDGMTDQVTVEQRPAGPLPRCSESAQTRPTVVVSPHEMNRRLQTVVGCPLTSPLHLQWASRAHCTGDGISSEIVVDQIPAFNKSRLKRSLVKIGPAAAQRLRQTIDLLCATG